MAIDELLDEHEQGERVRTWLRQNGAGLIGGVVLGLAAIGGWQWWQQQQLQNRVEASSHYDAAIEGLDGTDLDAGKLAAARSQAAKLGDSQPYSTLAGLKLARALVDSGQRDAAIEALRKLETGDRQLAALRDERLARLLIDAGKPADALKLVATLDSATAREVEGDAQLAMGKAGAAQDAYRKALARMDIGSPQRRLVELKLVEAGGTPLQPEANS